MRPATNRSSHRADDPGGARHSAPRGYVICRWRSASSTSEDAREVEPLHPGTMSEQQRVTARAATSERTPAWVWVVLAIWSLMLVAFLLISFGPRA
jgi:hypothetical protein